MLISVKVDPPRLFTAVRAMVVDEVRAFGSDDRGWHLLAVLGRISRLVGAPIQRVGALGAAGSAVARRIERLIDPARQTSMARRAVTSAALAAAATLAITAFTVAFVTVMRCPLARPVG